MGYLGYITIFFEDLLKNKSLIISLSKKEFKQQYAGSYLGLIWAFLQPVFTISIMWFVFQIGFKVKPVNDLPFILWLSAGMIPWMFFSDAVIQSTNTIVANTYLVKQIVFRVSILPIIKILSAMYVHIFFILILMFMFILYGYTPTIYWIQVFYFAAIFSVLILGIGLATSAINVFFRDIGQIVGILLQFGFWGTPIFWQINIVPDKYRYIIEFNPLIYIIEGYRNSLTLNKWFWEIEGGAALYYFIVTIFFLLVGVTVFKKLRPHFADVL